MITDEQIKQGLDKAYKKAGHNAYFGNGFEAGVKFALEQVKNIAYEPVLAVVYTITCGNSEIVEICKDEKIANKLADQMQEKDNYNSYWVDKRELK